MERILLTGANGFIGAHLARLLAQATDVDALYLLYNRRRDRLTDLEALPGIQTIACDLRRDDAVNRLADLPITSIIHCGTQRPASQSRLIDNTLYSANTTALINLANLAHRINVTRFIHFSAYGVFNAYAHYEAEISEENALSPGDGYEFSKAQEEAFLQYAVQHYPLNGVYILRLPGVFGPGKDAGAVYRFIENALANRPITINSPQSLYRMLYIDDVGQIITRLLKQQQQRGLEIFHIAGRDCFTLGQLANRITTLTASKSAITITDSHPAEKVILDISKSRRQLDFRPMGLDESLKRFIRHITAHMPQPLPTEE